MQHETSIKRQLHRERHFTPPYCPNQRCSNHLPKKAKALFSIRNGIKKIKRFPYFSQRFRCLDCNRTFSASFFCLYFRQKVWGFNEFIFKWHGKGVSLRELAREIHHSENMLRGRKKRMAQWSLLRHAKLTEDLKIEEPIVYDGLENFSFSQYDPNNINHAVGKHTLFTYDFNFCPLNRKGRMSPYQVKKKRDLEAKHGPYPRNAIRTTTKELFERMSNRAQNLCIFSDKHFQYNRVVRWDLAAKKIEHIKVSSKIHRNYQNPLFAVNNIDLMTRQNLAAFKRETISFSKHSVAMMESYVLYIVSRNYLRPKFWGTHRSDPMSSKRSPAMELGLLEKILTFKEFFSHRVLPSHTDLNKDWKRIIDREDPWSRRVIAA